MPDAQDPVSEFLSQFAQALASGTFAKLVLGKPVAQTENLQRIIARQIIVRGEPLLSLIHRHSTKDVTRNVPIGQAIETLSPLLGQQFRSAHLFTLDRTLQLDFSKKGRPMLSSTRSTTRAKPDSEHDRSRTDTLDASLPFLCRLGITDDSGRVLPSMSRKWRQIDRFAEIVLHAVDASPLRDSPLVRVADFGAGKGYLTFAIHALLQNRLHKLAAVTGVEIRPDLVESCNRMVEDLHLDGLRFMPGDIAHYDAAAPMDIMVALHACDTATDLALHKGIAAGAAIIISVPCCHKQIRPQLIPPEVLRPLLRFGIHREREAEMLTDSLRALHLEAAGYKVQISEFTSLEHTQRNSLILAIKRRDSFDPAPILHQIQTLKDFYGIKDFALPPVRQDHSSSSDCPMLSASSHSALPGKSP